VTSVLRSRVVARIALIGDLHGSWDERDVRAFNASDYDLLVFTGDLGSGTAKNGIDIARRVSRLTKPSIVMPGNNDAPYLPEIRAEFGHQRGIASILDIRATDAPRRARVLLCGYGVHCFRLSGHELSLVTARPCALGGGEFSFRDQVERDYGVGTVAQSTERLQALVDEVQTQRLLIVGHNGPQGLGHSAADIWGCDFRREEGDWGDPDLTAAIERAVERGLEVTVVAGHMHHRLRHGGQRRWQLERGGIRYINPARVPRIYPEGDREVRYHVALELESDGISVSEVKWTD